MNDALHPARSAEFLSRLHDGEVTAVERDAFDSHRRRCEECSANATAFEQALEAFRSAPTAPPAADLSARILRKIRAQSPARRPFGVMFGIDIRWAGIVVAALIVVLLSAPLLLRRPAPVAGPSPAIPVKILDAAPEKDTAPSTAPPRSQPDTARPEAPPSRQRAGDQAEPAPARAPAAENRAIAPAPLARREDVVSPLAAEAEAAGAGQDAASAATLSVLSADGLGPPPAVASRPPARRLAALRGREFTLIVEADGRVREVLSPSAGAIAKRGPAAAEGSSRAEPTDVFKELSFEPGDRPRRLTVRIE